MVVHYERMPFVVRAVERSNRRFVGASVRDPELREKLTPDYDFGCKRPSVSNTYLAAFNRSNVSLSPTRSTGSRRQACAPPTGPSARST